MVLVNSSVILRAFEAVLDRNNFVTEADVYFYKAGVETGQSAPDISRLDIDIGRTTGITRRHDD